MKSNSKFTKRYAAPNHVVFGHAAAYYNKNCVQINLSGNEIGTFGIEMSADEADMLASQLIAMAKKVRQMQ